MTKVLHITYDVAGGAGRAADRVHAAVRRVGVDSTLWSARPASGTGAELGAAAKRIYCGIRSRADAAINALMSSPNPAPRWPAAIPSAWSAKINGSTFDLVHLHWVCGGMMSVEDIGRIAKPLVWTMHDMWAFCGTENIAADERYAAGYDSATRPDRETGFDLNAWTWRRKQRSWVSGFQVVAPSRWMGECVLRSRLMRNWPMEVVANPIDTHEWRPQPRHRSRAALGLATGAPVLCVAGIDGALSPHKGYDLFLESLSLLARTRPVTVLVVGHAGTWRPQVPNVTFQFVGLVSDDTRLRAAYGACDVMVVPSRTDNLPNTAVEAASCGLPVVAFAVGGLPDIVDHGVTGYLAQPFDVGDLAQGIEWAIQRNAHGEIGQAARSLAVERFDAQRIGHRYSAVYDTVLARVRSFDRLPQWPSTPEYP